jgi:formate-dependent nitrite reductase membrane component NrfD
MNLTIVLPALVVITGVHSGYAGLALAGVAKKDSNELTIAITIERCIARLGAVVLIFTIPSSRH